MTTEIRALREAPGPLRVQPARFGDPPQGVPVVLTDPAERATWLAAPWTEAKTLQSPLVEGTLEVE